LQFGLIVFEPDAEDVSSQLGRLVNRAFVIATQQLRQFLHVYTSANIHTN